MDILERHSYESKDNIVGIVHLKQMLIEQKKGRGEEGVLRISRKPIYLSQREIVGDLLKGKYPGLKGIRIFGTSQFKTPTKKL